MTHFQYQLDSRWSLLFKLLGVKETDGVTLMDTELVATYGKWSVRTPLENVASATVDGPHRWYTAVGLRLSGKDDGITFGTTHRRGVTLHFKQPVPKVVLRKHHGSLWVSVADPEGLVAAIDAAQDP